MLLTASPEETYCFRTQKHAPWKVGENVICYRCGILLGTTDKTELGSLLDF